MKVHYDIAFAGGGGAALCLLYALHKKGLLARYRVLVLEPAAKRSNDRTWCFWSEGNEAAVQLFDEVISHRWQKVQLPKGKQDMAPYSYHQIHSGDFYRMVKETLQQYPKLEWQATKLLAVEEQVDKLGLQIEGNNEVTCSRLFDSRPPTDLPVDELLWQSFVGWRIRAAQNHFSPDTCSLMDFAVPQMDNTQFMYLLPTAEDEALVEFTRFGRAVLSEAEAEPVLQKYLRERGIVDYEILEREVNKIPMTLALNSEIKSHPAKHKIIPLGTRAGAVKASTGYAFKNMAAHAWDLAEALESKNRLPTPPGKKNFAFYDELLLRILSEKPQHGAPIFQQLFARKPIQTIFRFLDEKTSLREDLAIMYSMPWQPFLWSLSYSLRGLRSIRVPRTTTLPFSFWILLLSLTAVALHFFFTDSLTSLSPWLLLGGLIFPGIPHGAADHRAQLGSKALQIRQLLPFVLRYLGVVALVVFVWWAWPGVGLVLFLFYSAWHFGDTDFKSWEQKAGFASLLWGIGLLSFILLSHPHEFLEYLNVYELPTWREFIRQHYGILLIFSGLAILWPITKPLRNRLDYIFTLLIVLLGSFMPLLLAFGFYFIGCHSIRGWQQMKNHLRCSSLQLLRYTSAFSLGAFALAFVGALWMYYQNLAWSEVWPWAFVFIAAISAPHVWVMRKVD